MSVGEKKMSTMYEYLAAELKLFFSYKADFKNLIFQLFFVCCSKSSFELFLNLIILVFVQIAALHL